MVCAHALHSMHRRGPFTLTPHAYNKAACAEHKKCEQENALLSRGSLSTTKFSASFCAASSVSLRNTAEITRITAKLMTVTYSTSVWPGVFAQFGFTPFICYAPSGPSSPVLHSTGAQYPSSSKPLKNKHPGYLQMGARGIALNVPMVSRCPAVTLLLCLLSVAAFVFGVILLGHVNTVFLKVFWNPCEERGVTSYSTYGGG